MAEIRTTPEPVKYTWTVSTRRRGSSQEPSEQGVKAATALEARQLAYRTVTEVITSVVTDWVPVTNPPAGGPAGQEYQRGDRVNAKSQGRELSGVITAARNRGGEWTYSLDTGYAKVPIDGDDVYYLHPAGSR